MLVKWTRWAWSKGMVMRMLLIHHLHREVVLVAHASCSHITANNVSSVQEKIIQNWPSLLQFSNWDTKINIFAQMWYVAYQNTYLKKICSSYWSFLSFWVTRYSPVKFLLSFAKERKKFSMLQKALHSLFPTCVSTLHEGFSWHRILESEIQTKAEQEPSGQKHLNLLPL